MSKFPIDLGAYQRISLDPSSNKLTDEQKSALKANIKLCRDAIVFFTATGAARGVGGHTGGPFDTVPEVMILDALFRGSDDKFVPIFFDEAGHRVATQYLMSTLNGDLPAEQLMRYREAHSHLPGHPELGFTPGVKFSSGRLGHMWPYVNGVAMANPTKTLFCLGSDGSQQEGNDAEAARLAVAQQLNVKLIIDDNNVTIAGHPSHYLGGCSTAKTLTGHGLTVLEGDGEDIDGLYSRIVTAINTQGPVAIINHRPMCPGIKGLEGSTHGHDVISVKLAVEYLESNGQQAAADHLKSIQAPKQDYTFLGSSDKWDANRNVFGDAAVAILSRLSEAERVEKVRVIDSDLEGSCGLKKIHDAYPEIFISSGIMERGNFSAAAGFGMEAGKQGIFGTFSAFLEMCISEITMARLNNSNVLSHFSHSGIDDMADNTCHFGLNNMFADNGLSDGYATNLYFPADPNQMKACMETIFFDPGLRFVFSTRSKVPLILDSEGKEFFGGDYKFVSGKDEVIREGTQGYIVSFGESLYRALDAVERLKQEGIDVGLINKPTLNVIDEDMLAKIGQSPMVMVVEAFNRKTGLGSRFGSWLLERGHTPKYAHIATHKEGCGGLWEQFPHQGIDPAGIMAKAKDLLKG
ncbi:MAG: transketolase C-terminal domain-containing protein [Methylicorpusculum sp.]|uniref:transketolase C-terminal domain-containing protein n=1 Tax=Methylicorpusculum sp. TaxID=2713644 RepID=UPI002716586A|nr:transketolase C-terminal domain-containing protein [Methylicorpusculum sp.]MDO8845126.1 transketolase C-terminal domain-containing protein [Methylicorpusculum sp.]MDO8937758.1 transketolase C-terminal domain-containing protein [Methylicorpusculum sp.]MDP2177191.1 transketolase C-terminal domain-containing protein [Methylicorpusculum sp.]MDP2200556.1 transketolase C-terminal domain-containing protein [Methylicorpusculum sp.]MDP3529173.1 transketolase C-terminal domain-containing protein [Met